MDVDLGKYRRHFIGTFGVQLCDTVSDVGTRFIKNIQDIKRSAAAHAHQQHFHGARARIPASVVGGAIDDNAVPATGFRHKLTAFCPFYPCFHATLLIYATKGKSRSITFLGLRASLPRCSYLPRLSSLARRYKRMSDSASLP